MKVEIFRLTGEPVIIDVQEKLTPGLYDLGGMENK